MKKEKRVQSESKQEASRSQPQKAAGASAQGEHPSENRLEPYQTASKMMVQDITDAIELAEGSGDDYIQAKLLHLRATFEAFLELFACQVNAGAPAPGAQKQPGETAAQSETPSGAPGKPTQESPARTQEDKFKMAERDLLDEIREAIAFAEGDDQMQATLLLLRSNIEGFIDAAKLLVSLKQPAPAGRHLTKAEDHKLYLLGDDALTRLFHETERAAGDDRLQGALFIISRKVEELLDRARGQIFDEPSALPAPDAQSTPAAPDAPPTPAQAGKMEKPIAMKKKFPDGGDLLYKLEADIDKASGLIELLAQRISPCHGDAPNNPCEAQASAQNGMWLLVNDVDQALRDDNEALWNEYRATLKAGGAR